MISVESIFVDTSAWVALADKSGTNHDKAVSVYPSLLKTYKGLLTSNLVLAETHIIILNEMGHNVAMDFLGKVKTSPRILKVYADEEIEEEAQGILTKYRDQYFSYADAVSFAIMKKKKVKKAFCFDKHFLTAGFTTIP